MRSDRILPLALAACAAATLVHHAHNAEFLDQYPNLPAWLSRTWVYVAWATATGAGLLGYLLLRRGYRPAGLVLLFAYGCYGLDGLVHYALAPLSAHTVTMNVSIWLEAAAALVLLTLTVLVARQAKSAT
jgi:hypothetical protein